MGGYNLVLILKSVVTGSIFYNVTVFTITTTNSTISRVGVGDQVAPFCNQPGPVLSGLGTGFTG